MRSAVPNRASPPASEVSRAELENANAGETVCTVVLVVVWVYSGACFSIAYVSTRLHAMHVDVRGICTAGGRVPA